MHKRTENYELTIPAQLRMKLETMELLDGDHAGTFRVSGELVLCVAVGEGEFCKHAYSLDAEAVKGRKDVVIEELLEQVEADVTEYVKRYLYIDEGELDGDDRHESPWFDSKRENLHNMIMDIMITVDD